MLELEIDSKLVVDTLNGRTKRHNYASNFIHDALPLAARFSEIPFSYVRRNANNVAHKLAQVSLSLGEERIWLEDYPSCVAALVEQEKPCTA